MLHVRRRWTIPIAATFLFGIGFGGTITAFAQTATPSQSAQWWPECARADSGTGKTQIDINAPDCQDQCKSRCDNGYFTCMDCCNKKNDGQPGGNQHCEGATTPKDQLPHQDGNIP